MAARKTAKAPEKPKVEEEIEEALGEGTDEKPIPKLRRPPAPKPPSAERQAEVNEALEEAGAALAPGPRKAAKAPAVPKAPPAKAPATRAPPAPAPKPAPKEAAKPAVPKPPAAPKAEAPKPSAPADIIETKIDALCKALESAPKGELSLDELGKRISADAKSVEKVGRVLQDKGVSELIYPVSVFSKPSLRLLKPQQLTPKAELKGERLLENYDLSADGVPAHVNVWQVAQEARPVYEIRIAQPGPYTALFLESLRDRLAREVPILTEEITDPKKLVLLKTRFHEAAKAGIEADLPELEPRSKEILSGMLLHKMYGLGVLELLMVDDKLEEVAVNSSAVPISVYHKRIGWMKTTLNLDTEEEIYNYAAQIGRKAGREITLLNPILDAPLLSGDRVTATLFPISSFGNTITIRRFAREPWTMAAFMDPAIKSISIEMAAFLWLAVQYEMNVIFAGGTATGKCLAGDTQLITDRGVMPVREAVERELQNGPTHAIEDGVFRDNPDLRVPSLNPRTLKLEWKRVERVWRRSADHGLVRVRTRSGRTIEATPEHPFFVCNEGVVQKQAGDLRAGDPIAVPRRLLFPTVDSRLPLDKLAGCTLSRSNGVLYAQTKRAKRVRLPERWSNELARWTGYVIGDGHVAKDRSKIHFINLDEELLNDFMGLNERLFGVRGRVRAYNRTPYVELGSALVARFACDVLGIPSGEKSHAVRVPHTLLLSRESHVRNLLLGLFESEVGVNARDNNLEFSTASPGLAEDVYLALLRLDVLCTRGGTPPRNRLFIGGKDVRSYARSVGFLSNTKKKALDRALTRTRFTNYDFVPGTAGLMRAIKTKLRLFDSELAGRGSCRESITSYENDKRLPTRESLQRLCRRMEARLEALQYLQQEVESATHALGETCKIETLTRQLCSELGIAAKHISLQAAISKDTRWHWKKEGVQPKLETLEKLGRTMLEEFDAFPTRLVGELRSQALGLTAREIAQELGMSEGAIYPYLRGERHRPDVTRRLEEISMARIRTLRERTARLEPLAAELRETLERAQAPAIDRLISSAQRTLHLPLLKTTKTTREKALANIQHVLREALSEESRRQMQELRALAVSDVLWDPVVEVARVSPKEPWVYDLTVEDNHTFIANHIIAHNTSALNAASMFIPGANRIVTVEETRELLLPSFLRWNWVPFVTRGANPEGKGEVTMLDLMVASLRMRPDRIIVGEVRRSAEAEVLFEAMHTGHAVYSTLHADNAQQAVRRLTNEPIKIPPTELETLQLFVVQYRDRRTGIRRTSEITELVPGVAGEVNLNPIYRWRARTDTFEKVGESVRVVNELSTHTGMTLDEINGDIASKEQILEWMVKQGMKGAEQVGAVMNLYYRDPSVVEAAAAKNLSPDKVL